MFDIIQLKIVLHLQVHNQACSHKSVLQKNNFLISQPKHMLWVLKRTVSMRRFFWAPKAYMLKNIYNFTQIFFRLSKPIALDLSINNNMHFVWIFRKKFDFFWLCSTKEFSHPVGSFEYPQHIFWLKFNKFPVRYMCCETDFLFEYHQLMFWLSDKKKLKKQNNIASEKRVYMYFWT